MVAESPGRRWLPDIRDSSPYAVVALLLSNLVPLIGVLAGWDVLPVLVLYWFESGVVGLFNVARIWNATTEERKLKTSGFFSLHYGGFWLMHGAAVITLFADETLIADGTHPLLTSIHTVELIVRDPTLGIGLAAVVISHGVSFWCNFIGRGEYRRISSMKLILLPYARVVVLHLTVIGAALVVLSGGSPIFGVALLVVLKTAVDLCAHLLEHRNLRERIPERTAAGPFRE